MKQLWIQYSYDAPKKASVCQTAESKRQAKRDDEIFQGNPWYRYDVSENDSLTNEDGPYWFGPQLPSDYR